MEGSCELFRGQSGNCCELFRAEGGNKGTHTFLAVDPREDTRTTYLWESLVCSTRQGNPYERLTRPDAATTRTSRYLVGPPGASSVRVTACAAVLCHAPLVPSPKNGVVQTRSPRSGSPKSPSSLDAPRTCVQRRLTFTHLSPCLSHWPVGPETNHETTSPCNIPFVQHPLPGHRQGSSPTQD